MKQLPKYITQQLTPAETRLLNRLQVKSDSLGETMLKHQSAYVIAFRKNKSDKRLPALADKGFKYERLAFDAVDKLNLYKKALHTKYSR